MSILELPIAKVLLQLSEKFYESLELLLGILSLLSNLLDKLAQDIGLALDLVTLSGSKAALGEDTVQARKLLGGIALALVELVEDAHVVLGVLVLSILLELLGLLLDLGSDVGDLITAEHLGDKSVEGSNRAGDGVELAARDTVGAGLLVDVLDEGVLGTATLVRNAVLAAGREELDGRVRADALLLGDGLAVGRLGINLGDDDILIVVKVVSKSLPRGGEVLAVLISQLASFLGH